MRTHSSASLLEPYIVHQLSRRSIKRPNFSEKCTQKTWRSCNNWHELWTRQCVSNTLSTQCSIRKKMIRGLKNGDSVKQIKGTRCMRLGSNGGVRSVNTNHSIAWSRTNVTRLMTCSGASDDTTNIYLGQGPNDCSGASDDTTNVYLGWT
jgi:hypothetical protein